MKIILIKAENITPLPIIKQTASFFIPIRLSNHSIHPFPSLPKGASASSFGEGEERKH